MKKGNEIIPARGESFGRKEIGPIRRNLDKPNDEEKRLNKKVKNGKTDSFPPGIPDSGSDGRNPCIAKIIANDICT